MVDRFRSKVEGVGRFSVAWFGCSLGGFARLSGLG